jgi:maleylpyruvate isomerase
VSGLDEARAALRARQGAGARYDAPLAPAADLDFARRGTAYFARLLNNLDDAGLDAPSAQAETSRRAIIATVGLQARLMAETIAWCRAGEAGALPHVLSLDAADIALAATLPSRALRNLFTHSEVHLNVEWRDMTDGDWSIVVSEHDGRNVALAALPVLRARSLWSAAFDLGAGARCLDVPKTLFDGQTADPELFT